ncbi:SDR family NAD(P)-dependent oxidoreductase [Flectobacillus longus]|uniref:SDR family NAD(P)-dependent oxidoreductase n=1 Tax=Flectobacillus longus TaxID=2984207 RepID=UPI0024B78312|nr:SDR family oxidoreductase [Flectobacillus longus]MDI9882361.1 SDR family oxidoreductase [Flectobacillus longus]
MTKTFLGQTAILTGAGIGIGFEVARLLAIRGVNIVLNDMDENAAKNAQKAILDSGGNCEIVIGNSADLEIIKGLVQKAVYYFGKIDLVVANAGITTFGDFFEYQPASLKQLLDVNLFGSFFLVQEATKVMKEQRTGGSIVLTSSVTGHQAHPFLAAYGMTKAAIEQLAKNLVIDLSPLGININTVAPGATLTERTLEDKDYLSTWSRITPMGKPATVQDIAEAMLFLLSPKARHITGQSLVVDGGWTAVGVSPY